MIKYVCGLLFDLDGNKVALIRKNRPEWQKGLLNGIGGKIEPLELPREAMQREFNEEAGVDISDWKNLLSIYGEDYTIYFYYLFSSAIYDVETKTDEDIILMDLKDLHQYKTVDTLDWLIDLALYRNKHTKQTIVID